MARALAHSGMESANITSHEQADRFLTSKRQELLETLAAIEQGSARSLTRELGRDKEQVSRDLSVLVEEELIAFESDGQANRPHLTCEHIVVNPNVWSVRARVPGNLLIITAGYSSG